MCSKVALDGKMLFYADQISLVSLLLSFRIAKLSVFLDFTIA